MGDFVLVGGSVRVRAGGYAGKKVATREGKEHRALVPIERIRERHSQRERRIGDPHCFPLLALFISPAAHSSGESRSGSLQGRVEVSPNLLLEPSRGESHRV